MQMIDGPRLATASGGKPTSLVVLIHGYGSNGDDMIGLAGMVQPMLPDAAFVAPDAPTQLPTMADARQWWPIVSFSAAERDVGAVMAAPSLDAFLTEELRAAGLPDDRLLLVGFSQGAMMALHVGLRRASPVAGIIGISGMLVAPSRLPEEIVCRPPVLLIHGTEDGVVPFRSLDTAASALRATDVQVETHISSGVGHSVAPDGLSAAIAFARHVLG